MWRGHDLGASGSVRLDFLGAWSFFSEDPDYVGWISLDFLGFSRQNRDFSMGYAGKSVKSFFNALFPRCEKFGSKRRGPGLRKSGFFMGQAYPNF
jgi:hypothetical protein